MTDSPTLNVQIVRGLQDRIYDKRKAAALEIEKLIKDYITNKKDEKIRSIIDTLVQEFAYSVNPNARNGGLTALAAASIALGPDNIAAYLNDIIPPILACFTDQESRVRYYACESTYNVAKVAKGEILRYFNEVFDAMSKLAADSDHTVKSGTEILDRLIKDIVSEQSTTYVSILVQPQTVNNTEDSTGPPSMPRTTAFSLPRFIPLLAERIRAKNPFTRMFLVTWITVLDSVPDLELVSFLPDFFDGLLDFLSDPNKDVRYATSTAIANFLREIKEAVEVREQQKVQMMKNYYGDQQRKLVMETASDADGNDINWDLISIAESEGKNKGSWVPGQGVVIDYTRLVKILMPHLSSQEEGIQEIALRWINEFILIAKEVIVPFTPQLIAAVLPSLAHPVILIKNLATETNQNLHKLILDTPTAPPPVPIKGATAPPSMFSAVASAMISTTPAPSSNTEPRSHPHNKRDTHLTDPFDYQDTVEALMLQLMNDHEETRVASLEWLLMLHKKAPKKILAIDDGTFPALLKTLSDQSEEVVKRDLQLLAQISSNSEGEYFNRFMVDLLKLFSTDRRLLESRGSLIIRQLCLSLNSERIYRSFAEILEKEEDLEFASTMVQNLNIILITSPELSDLRKRLKSLETKDGQMQFIVLYRSWCHNPVATFSLCLLAQAYEHAANMLQSFAELDISVNLLIQIDKLVQLLESPVFTYLRLQLLEPEKYPHLFKCLYGVLMLLPQSSAFATLRNRLNSVSSMGFLHLVPKSLPEPKSRSKSGPTPVIKDDIKWADLLLHFRTVQSKHEKTRKQSLQALNRSSSSARSSRRNRDRDRTSQSLSKLNGPANDRPGNGANPTGQDGHGAGSNDPKGRRMSNSEGAGRMARPTSPSPKPGKK